MHVAVLELGASPEREGRTGDSWTPVLIVSPSAHQVGQDEPRREFTCSAADKVAAGVGRWGLERKSRRGGTARGIIVVPFRAWR